MRNVFPLLFLVAQGLLWLSTEADAADKSKGVGGFGLLKSFGSPVAAPEKSKAKPAAAAPKKKAAAKAKAEHAKSKAEPAPAAAAAPGSGTPPGKATPGATAKAEATSPTKAAAPRGDLSLDQMASEPSLAEGLSKAYSMMRDGH